MRLALIALSLCLLACQSFATSVIGPAVPGAGGGGPDSAAPQPDPLTWNASSPSSVTSSGMTLTATVATDAGSPPVEYSFECQGCAAFDSGWQASNVYSPTGMSSETEYLWKVRARDSAAAPNITAYSAVDGATTLDVTAPVPTTATWSGPISGITASTMTMHATVATDFTGVEYQFTCLTEGGGPCAGYNSDWQSSPDYTANGLLAETQYVWRVQYRDTSPAQNLGTISSSDATNDTATTLAASAVLFFDSFTRSDSTDLTNGGSCGAGDDCENWIEQGGDWSVASNQLVVPGNSLATFGSTGSLAHCMSGVVTSAPAGRWTGAVLRFKNAASRSYAFRHQTDLEYHLRTCLLDVCSTFHIASYATLGAMATGDAIGACVNDGIGAATEFTLYHWIARSAPTDITDWDTDNDGIQTVCASGCDAVWSESDPGTAGGYADEGTKIGWYNGASSSSTVDNVRGGTLTPPVPDTTPPTPSTSTWASVIDGITETSMTMHATTCTDASGVSYQFTCLTEGGGACTGHDSTWQASSSYTATGLTAATEYVWRVQCRDQSPALNTNTISSTDPTNDTATTSAADSAAPTPSPATWASVIDGISSTGMTLHATTGTDATGVEYKFTCLTEGGGACGDHDSGWQASSSYSVSGLTPETEYVWRVQMRDTSAAQNLGTISNSDPTNDTATTTAAAGTSSGQSVTYTNPCYSIQADACTDITFNFQESGGDATYGQFANGDYWVLDAGNLVITSITPASSGTGASQRNGAMLDPNWNSTSAQPFDGRTESAAFNESLDLALPYDPPGTGIQSIVKVVSVTDARGTGVDSCNDVSGYYSCADFAAVLTIVHSVPTDNGATVFRPTYSGGATKTLYSTGDLIFNASVSLVAPPSGTYTLPTMAQVTARYAGVQLDMGPLDKNHEVIPQQNAWLQGSSSTPADYGAELGRDYAVSLLRAFVDDTGDTAAERDALVINLVQAGIDYYGVVESGRSYRANAGLGVGRKLPVVFAATALDDATMKAFIAAAAGRNTRTTWLGNVPPDYDTWSEDGQIFYSSTADGCDSGGITGGVLWGEHGQFWNTSLYCNYLAYTSGDQSVADVYAEIDGGKPGVNAYQDCCTSGTYIIEAAATNMWSAIRTTWDNEDFFTYVYRWDTYGKYFGGAGAACDSHVSNACAGFDGSYGGGRASATYNNTFGVGKNGYYSNAFGRAMFDTYDPGS